MSKFPHLVDPKYLSRGFRTRGLELVSEVYLNFRKYSVIYLLIYGNQLRLHESGASSNGSSSVSATAATTVVAAEAVVLSDAGNGDGEER